jgi:hypothetical protein
LAELEEVMHMVGWGDGNEDHHAAVSAYDRRDAAKRDPVEAKDASKQRAPRHGDRDERCRPSQRSGERFGSLDEEDRVWRVPTGSRAHGEARRFGHARGIGVDADDQGPRFGDCACEDGATVTGAEVDDDPFGPGHPLIDLADVDVEDAPADHLLHSSILASRPPTPSHE